MLGNVPVGAGQAEPPVRQVGVRAPDLLSIDHPLVAVLRRPGAGTGEVRTGRRLREELADERLPGQDSRYELLEELGLTVGDHGWDADVEGGTGEHSEVGQNVVAGFVQERDLVLGRQALAAVLLGPGNSGIPTLIQDALQRSVGGHDIGGVVVDLVELPGAARLSQ